MDINLPLIAVLCSAHLFENVQKQTSKEFLPGDHGGERERERERERESECVCV
jgi:hypothetical protein